MASDVRVVTFAIVFTVLLLCPTPTECNMFASGVSHIMTLFQRAKTFMKGDTICQYICANGTCRYVIDHNNYE